MAKPWRNELQRIAALLLAGAFVGVMAGNIVFGLLIFITAYLCWHLYNVHRLVSLSPFAGIEGRMMKRYFLSRMPARVSHLITYHV